MSERLGTHWETCWQSATHHGCALTRIASLERQLEEARAQRDEHARWRSDLADKLHIVEALLAERTRERDEARVMLHNATVIYEDIAREHRIKAERAEAERDALVRERERRLSEDAQPCCGKWDTCMQRCWPLIGELRSALAAAVRRADEYRHVLIDIRLRLHAAGRRPEECYEMAAIDAAIRDSEKPNANLP